MFTSHMMLHSISKRAFASSAQALKHAAAPVRDLGTLTIPEKMVSVQIDEASGVVTHNYLFDEAGANRTFANEKVYKNWLASQRLKMYRHYRDILSPVQFWVT